MPTIAFLVGVLYLPWLISGGFAPRWWAVLIGAPLVLASSPPRWSPVHPFLLMFLGLAALSLIWTDPLARWDGAGAVIKLAALVAVFSASAAMRSSKAVFLAAGWACIINAAIALVQATGIEFLNPLTGISGTFVNRDILAEFGTLTLLGLIYSGVTGPIWLYNTSVASALVCAMLPGSRDAYLTLTMTAVFIFAKHFQWMGRAAIWLSTGCVMGALLWVDSLNPLRWESMSNRLDFWAIAAANLTPLGWGYGNYYWLYPWHYAHNEYIQLISDMGIFTMLLVPVVWYAWREKHFLVERVVLFAFGVECLVGFPLHDAATAFLAAFCLGRLVGVHKATDDYLLHLRHYYDDLLPGGFRGGATADRRALCGSEDRPAGDV